MDDPNHSSPLDYEPQPPQKAGSKAMKTAGLVLMMTGAAFFICAIVGIILVTWTIRTSPSPTPDTLATGISRSLCFSVLGITFLALGVILRALGSRKRTNDRH